MEASLGASLLPSWLSSTGTVWRATSSPGSPGAIAALPSSLDQEPLCASARLSFALLGGAAAAGTLRARRGRPKFQVLCRAASDDEEDAARQLAELEAELEALEDMEEAEIERSTSQKQAELLQKVDSSLSSAPSARTSTIATSAGASAEGLTVRVAVCGTGSESSAAQRLLARLQSEASDSLQPVWLDLAEASRLSFEDVDERLQKCTAAVICPDPTEDSPEALEAARLGLRAVLASAPYELTQVILVSHVGAQDDKGGFNIGAFFNQSSGTSWGDVEDELTSTARTRTSSRPLRYVIVRAADPPASASSGTTVVQCFAESESSPDDTSTSPALVAEAVMQVFNFGVNTNFSIVEAKGASEGEPDWPELLLPFIGPELWRTDVDDPKRAAFFVQQWADEFFGPGKGSMRMGVKTPVQVESTSSGVMFKFRPLGTGNEVAFGDLDDGGLEFLVEEPPSGAPRLRVRRCAYGWKVTVKENSERALLEKFQRDWAEVSKA